jgi:glycosyltransferase involved in cell wall biosynthesis
MRIVVVNNFFPPRVGGSSHLSDALAKGYAARDHEVLVVTAAYGDAPARAERDGVRIVRLPAVMLPETRFAVSFDLSFATRPTLDRDLGRLLDEFRPDVVHQHGQFMDLTWASGRYARRRGIPALLSVHTRLENPAALYRHTFRTLDATMVAPRLRRYRPRIVVMDAHMRDYITSRYRGGYRDLVPIPVGVDPGWVRGGDPERGRQIAGVGDAPILLSVGHVIPLRDRVGLVFTPHLVPMIRGMFSTLYATLTAEVDVQALFAARYAGEPFVDVLPPGSMPDTRSVRGSNMLRIAVHRPKGSALVMLLVVQDNLVKGAAGQAIQNMNLMLGLPETRGLAALPLLP